MEHSKLPFNCKKATCEDNVWCIYWGDINVGRILGEHEGEAEATAQYIVKACNSHAELLEACKTVNKDISRFRSTYVRPVTLEKIRQAIAKAEGGE